MTRTDRTGSRVARSSPARRRPDRKGFLMKRTSEHPRRGAGVVLAVAALCAALAMPMIPTAGAVVETASADMVIEWHGNAMTAVFTNARQGPTVAVLSLAIVQGAVYDAVNAIEGGYQPYLAAPAADPEDSMDAAVATAAHHTLVALFPTQQTTLDALYAESLAEIPNGPGETGGIVVGAQAAATMLAARANDGRGGPFTVVESFGPGEWRRTPPGLLFEPAPWVGNVRPFLIKSAASLRSKGPNPLTSDAYTEDFKEVKRIGSLTSTVRTADQTDAAIYWQDNGGALWNRIFASLVVSRNLDGAQAARLLAMTNMAAADGAIACWNDKYYWNFWRPITAIREAATDGNPATVADPNWNPLFATPPFPEHPSGHSCVSTAIVRTLQNFFGTDKIAFSAFSNNSLTTRSFNRFSEAIKEILDARVWAGIHFRTADMQGSVIGKKVAHRLENHYFQPVA